MIGLIWSIAYFLVFGLPLLLLPKAIRKKNKLMNRIELERDLYKFVNKHNDWGYVVIHFNGDDAKAKTVTVYSNKKRGVNLDGRHRVEAYLNNVYKLDPDVRSAILDNYSDSYNLHNNGYKNLDERNAKKIAKVLELRFGGHMEILYKTVGYVSAPGFYVKSNGDLGYDSGSDGDTLPHFIIIYSKDRWNEKQNKRKQERDIREEKGYKGY